MTFVADAHLKTLKQFQRATVDHVDRRFYEDTPAARRFLVADETGLGKSLVARGVIAKTIERLQHDASVERIDIVYVCSNSDIAQQNLERLDVLDSGSKHHATRLTLLARDSGHLRGAPDPEVGKRVNLISFTPGTSFDMGSATGRSDERTLLHHILCEALDLSTVVERRAAAVVLRGNSELKNFRRQLDYQVLEPDSSITRPFLKAIRSSGLRTKFVRMVQDLGRRTADVTSSERAEHARLVGEMRACLARASVDALEPDLIILDEFQRFRHLLAIDDPSYREAAELAHALFDHGEAKVLLLSATPYKPFTYAEEAAAGDDHEADLRRTLGFLAGDQASPDVADIVDRLAQFRTTAIKGESVRSLRSTLEQSLTRLMCRTERPRLGEDGMLLERLGSARDVTAADVDAYVTLRRLARELDSAISVDYWKSSPYFVNFSDGYQLGSRLRERLKDPESREALRPLLRSTQHLDRRRIEALSPIDPGNARLRALMEDTVDRGWWKLLWAPPSLPYIVPGGPFAESGVQGMTKRLIFSSWMAAPTSIASLVSYEARRLLAGSAEELESRARRLQFRLDGQRPGAMTTLATFWPSPVASLASDPRGPVPVLEPSGPGGAEPWYWTEVFRSAGSIPAELLAAQATIAFSVGDADDGEAAEAAGAGAHVELALALHASDADATRELRTSRPDDALTVGAYLGRFGPGNIAYRCLHRLVGSEYDAVSDVGLWTAAANLSNGIRRLFDRRESMLLLDQLLPEHVYWRAVLEYCRWGNLEAVLDEYLHHLSATARSNGIDDSELLDLANKAVDAMTMLPSNYTAFDPLHPDKPIRFSGSRFALRYGNKRADNDESARQPAIRTAFNSPFWPFVLATTSVGQEGIDFHWWCHATLHWNTPASPVDFEQREGRVHRFGGQAIRRNLAQRYSDQLLAGLSVSSNLWDDAFVLGSAAAGEQFGELTPHWIFDGDSKIERHLLMYPLSSDETRYQRLKDDLTVYRLSFGQPRQEDLIELLRRRGAIADPSALNELRLDLRPPGVG